MFYYVNCRATWFGWTGDINEMYVYVVEWNITDAYLCICEKRAGSISVYVLKAAFILWVPLCTLFLDLITLGVEMIGAVFYGMVGCVLHVVTL